MLLRPSCGVEIRALVLREITLNLKAQAVSNGERIHEYYHGLVLKIGENLSNPQKFTFYMRRLKKRSASMLEHACGSNSRRRWRPRRKLMLIIAWWVKIHCEFERSSISQLSGVALSGAWGFDLSPLFRRLEGNE